MPELYTFDANSTRAIADEVRKLQREIKDLRAIVAAGERRGVPVGRMHIAKTGDSELPAMTTISGKDVPGKADCKLWEFSNTDRLIETRFTREIFNTSATAIAANTFFHCWQELCSGRLVTQPITGLRRARLTEDLDDDNAVAGATANVWDWDAEEEEYFDTEEEVLLHSFLRPEGEVIPDRTRVLFTRIGDLEEIVVNNCSPDPEEETP